MKILLLILTFAFISCGENNTKQKELELKERERVLQEKELALKQRDTIIKQATTVAPQNIPTKVDAHSDFATFWINLKTAVNEGNQDVISKMVIFPFKDEYTEVRNTYMNVKKKTRTSNSIPEFKNNYHRIFSPLIIELINSDTYITFSSKSGIGNAGNDLKNGDYLIQNEQEGLLIRKVNGIYKILLIKKLDLTYDAM